MVGRFAPTLTLDNSTLQKSLFQFQWRGDRVDEIELCLRVHHFDLHWEQIIAPAFNEAHFRKVGDSKMSGILTDLVRNAKFYLSDQYYCKLTLPRLSMLLNDIPQTSRKIPFSHEAFKSLELPN